MKRRNGYKEEPDALLWEKMVNGDKFAFEQLYRRYYSPLLTYALSFRNDEDFAKDCIQDFFIKLFLSENLKPILYVRAYLYRSLRNSVLDKIDETPYFQEIDETVLIDYLAEDIETTHLFSKEDKHLIQSKLLLEAFKQLSENQRNAVYLYYIKEFSWNEMAVNLDITPHSCMNLVARSVVKLRSLMDSLKKK